MLFRSLPGTMLALATAWLALGGKDYGTTFGVIAVSQRFFAGSAGVNNCPQLGTEFTGIGDVSFSDLTLEANHRCVVRVGAPSCDNATINGMSTIDQPWSLADLKGVLACDVPSGSSGCPGTSGSLSYMSVSLPHQPAPGGYAFERCYYSSSSISTCGAGDLTGADINSYGQDQTFGGTGPSLCKSSNSCPNVAMSEAAYYDTHDTATPIGHFCEYWPNGSSGGGLR